MGKTKRRYVASLDGLRALAVMAVIFYHLNCTWAQGGLLGVTVFFVLSGYLITGILVGEWLDTGHIDLPRFWLRRVRRLFPAIAAVVIVVAALCVLFNHPLLTKMRPDIVPSLFWFQNWWYVFRGLSYFDALGDPSPLTHFWSLAIEEQFYLVWPLILIGIFKLGGEQHSERTRKLISRGCLLLAIVSALAMAFIYDPQGDPTRVYYGTDTRAFSLLLGGWLSIAWPADGFTDDGAAHEDMRAVRGLDIVGSLALGATIAMMTSVDGMSPFMYRGGIALCSLLTAIVIAALVHPHGILARLVALEPFVWIGQRSYGMYLWHYPIILLLKPLDNAENGYSLWFIALVVVLVLVVSELSFRFIEDPIRHGAIGKWLKSRKMPTQTRPRTTVASAAPAGVLALCLCVALVGGVTVPDTSLVPEEAITSTGASADTAMTVSGAADNEQENESEPKAKPAPKKKKAAKPAAKKTVYNPLLVGDSVPGDAYGNFKPHFPHGHNDSFVGRTFEQALKVYQGYEDQKAIGEVVIFACFSNNELEDDELDKMYDEVGKKKDIFLVNIEVPDRFEERTNDLLYDFAHDHKNIHVIDWNGTVAGHKDTYLYGDKTHLTPTGAKAYYGLIRDVLEEYLPKKDIA